MNQSSPSMAPKGWTAPPKMENQLLLTLALSSHYPLFEVQAYLNLVTMAFGEWMEIGLGTSNALSERKILGVRKPSPPRTNRLGLFDLQPAKIRMPKPRLPRGWRPKWRRAN